MGGFALTLALVAAAIAMVAMVVWGLRGGARLQRRLFLSHLLLAWIPALLVLVVYGSLSQRQVRLIDSPGLGEALEAAVGLARESMAQQVQMHQARADSLAQHLNAGGELGNWPPTWAAVRHFPGGGALVYGDFPSESGRRKSVAELDDGGSLSVLWKLPPELEGQFDRVTQGHARLAQLRLFYGRLLRADTLVSVALVTLALLVISLLWSRRLARQIAQPVQRLAVATAKVAQGDLDHRVQGDAVDEVSDLVRGFNDMTRDLKTSKETLVRTERIAAWQGVARRLAHEIKNPLTPIHLSIHRLRGNVQDAELVECLDTILEETEHLKRLADEFSLYARLPAPELQSMVARPLLEQVVGLYCRHDGIEVQWEDWNEGPGVLADEGQLRQVFSNVVKNAVEAMGERGRLQLGATVPGETVRIQIQDDGPGLPENDDVFGAGYTTKGAGTGLGLAISRKIMEDHGGSIAASSAPDGGTVFTIELPVARGAQ